jgi:hypothetical protein
MAAVLRSRILSVSIARPPKQVYGFVSNPENLPKWAMGLCRSVRRADGGWIVETPAGPMRFRFVGQNAFGVLDHYVSPTADLEILNPMRVVPNGSGSEVIFTLFQQPDMSDAQFAQDAGMVERDLKTLKTILEG